MTLPDYTNCTLCPRMCHVNRHETTGYCGCSDHILAARAALHKWEEPVLSGPEEEPGGSGAVFFSGLYSALLLLPKFCTQQGAFWKRTDTSPTW